MAVQTKSIDLDAVLDSKPITNGILRFATAGSVDDGKSSLIGRLLYDSKSILEDQLLAIERTSRQRGADQVELALLTDGLRAEREQNITIDVAYRYFSTPRRKFIVADTPGHLQYTRNMVTGTSTVDLSVVLIDARNGVLSQSKRHAAISSLLGVRQLVVAVNKMDLVGYDRQVFEAIRLEFESFLPRLGAPNAFYIPISALLGDNVVDASHNMPWFEGPTLLNHLEEVEVERCPRTGFRLPVQYVVRPDLDFRGFAGTIEAGRVRVGDPVLVVSSGIKSKVRSIHVAGVPAEEATENQAALVTLEHDIDVSRGDLLTSLISQAQRANKIEAVVCWLHPSALEVGRRYILLHTTRRVSSVVERVVERIDVDSLDPVDADGLNMNDLGRVEIHCASELFFDRYEENPRTGSFVLVDPGSHVTVAAGMIQRPVESGGSAEAAPGRAIWLDGWPLDGDSIAEEVRRFGKNVVALDRSLAGEHDSVLRALTQQGFDVLVIGNLSEDERASWSRFGTRFPVGTSTTEEVVEAVLRQLEESPGWVI